MDRRDAFTSNKKMVRIHKKGIFHVKIHHVTFVCIDSESLRRQTTRCLIVLIVLIVPITTRTINTISNGCLKKRVRKPNPLNVSTESTSLAHSLKALQGFYLSWLILSPLFAPNPVSSPFNLSSQYYSVNRSSMLRQCSVGSVRQ